MNKKMLSLAASTAIVGGVLSVAQVASAQTDDSDATDRATSEESDNSTEEGRRSGDRKGNRNNRGGRSYETVAEAIGIEVDELRAALESGQSIADVATDNGVDPDSVIEAIVANSMERLDEKVEAGRLTQEEADERLDQKTERITAKVFDTDDDDSDEDADDSGDEEEAEVEDEVEGEGS